MINPVPAPEQGEPPSWAADTRARDEERYYPDEEKLRFQRSQNDLWWLRSYGVLIVILTWFFTFLFMISLGCWVWHYLMPTGFHWLSIAQLSKIQSVVFSGSLGAIVSAVARKQINK